ncbi:MAG: alpha/beta hydrolase [Jannaschia sp.]
MEGLTFERGGRRGGPTLVLIHPMGADLRFWDTCRGHLEPRFDCLAMDLPAAGSSPDPAGLLSLTRQAEILAEMLDEIEIDRFVAVGCAVGAMIAVHLLARRPDRSMGAVLANPGLRTEGPARSALAARAAAVRDGGMAAIAEATVARAFEGQTDEAARATFADRFLSQDPERYARQIDGMLDADISKDLLRIRCPALISVGGYDRLLPPDIGRKVAADWPGASLIEYPDAAHFIPYQSPGPFSRDLMQWLIRA